MKSQEEKQEQIDKIMGDVIIVKSGAGKGYRHEDKQLAVAILFASQSLKNGEMRPDVKIVSKMTQVPERTLYNWWGERAALSKLTDGFLAGVDTNLAYKVAVEMGRLIDSIAKKGYEGMEQKEKASLLKELRTTFLLLRPPKKEALPGAGGAEVVFPDGFIEEKPDDRKEKAGDQADRTCPKKGE